MRPRPHPKVLLCYLACLALLSASYAHAALGGDRPSVLADQTRFQASLRTTPAGPFVVHEMRLPTGIVVREYESSGGQIFAVTWHGPWLPDMRQLLGAFFERYAEAAQAQVSRHAGRQPWQSAQPDFVVQSTGRTRSFAGRAYLPGMLPPGVTVESLQ